MNLSKRLALDRPELRAWAMYDWANSAFMTTIVATVFPIYFVSVVAEDLNSTTASFRFALITSIALGIAAIVAPLLGALADYSGIKKKMLAACLLLGVVATACMFFIQKGDLRLASALFVLGNVGATASLVFYDALLPHVAHREETDRLSTAGYALGYLGGGLLLAINLIWIQWPEMFGLAGPEMAMRFSFLSVAIWWAGFSIPIFRTVKEPARRLEVYEQAGENPIRAAFTRLQKTFNEIRTYRQVFLMMLAFLIYNDGIVTIIRMAAIYGSEIGFTQGTLISAILLVQFIGIPFALLFGQISTWIGPKRSIFLTLAIYIGISSLGYFMKTPLQFYLLAMLVGMVQGGAQALSRSMFSSMVPSHKSSEFFAFFGVFEKFAGIIGPALFALMIFTTGSSRNAILSIIFFFVVGAALLALVDQEEGQRIARQAESGSCRV